MNQIQRDALGLTTIEKLEMEAAKKITRVVCNMNLLGGGNEKTYRCGKCGNKLGTGDRRDGQCVVCLTFLDWENMAYIGG